MKTRKKLLSPNDPKNDQYYSLSDPIVPDIEEKYQVSHYKNHSNGHLIQAYWRSKFRSKIAKFKAMLFYH